tara:strand:- start:1966 stop:2166 length:201 start_codon:yes stop_codon:yes gene_type:complete
LVKGVDEATLLEHGQPMRALWADFARTGQLPATGHIGPQVLEWWEVKLALAHLENGDARPLLGNSS